MKISRRSIIGILIAIFVLTIGVSGFFYRQYISFEPPSPKTPDGISLERLLPPETVFAVITGPTDNSELARAKDLFSRIAQDKQDVLLPLIMGELAKQGITLPVSMQEIEKLFGERTEFAFAAINSPKNNPEFYFLESVADKETANGFVERFSGNQNIHAGLVADVLFLTNAEKPRADLVFGRAVGKGKSLVHNREFRKAVAYMKPPLSAYFFIDRKADFGFLSAISRKIPDVSSIVAASNAMDDGYHFESFAFGGPAWMHDPYVVNLYKKIPGMAPILFAESHHTGSMIAEMAKDHLETFKQYTGFNFTEDLQPFLDKGAVITVADIGELVPAVSFFADASGAPEKAEAIIKKIGEQVPQWVSLVNLGLQSEKETPIMEHKNLARTSGETIFLYIDRLIKKRGRAIPLFEGFKNPLQISYGMTEDNIFFISMLPNIEDQLAAPTTIEQNPLYKDATALYSQPSSFVIMDSAAIGTYAARIVSFAREKELFSEANETAFALLEKHLAPILGFVEASKPDSQVFVEKGLFKIRSD